MSPSGLENILLSGHPAPHTIFNKILPENFVAFKLLNLSNEGRNLLLLKRHDFVCKLTTFLNVVRIVKT